MITVGSDNALGCPYNDGSNGVGDLCGDGDIIDCGGFNGYGGGQGYGDGCH